VAAGYRAIGPGLCLTLRHHQSFAPSRVAATTTELIVACNLLARNALGRSSERTTDHQRMETPRRSEDRRGAKGQDKP